jgi:hypothetical protein
MKTELLQMRSEKSEMRNGVKLIYHFSLFSLFILLSSFLSCHNPTGNDGTGSFTISIGSDNSRVILPWDTIDSSTLIHEITVTDSSGAEYTDTIPLGGGTANFTQLAVGSCYIYIEGIDGSNNVKAVGTLTTTLIAGNNGTKTVLMGPPTPGMLGIVITTPIASTVKLTPITDGTYTERKTTFTVEVRGFLSDSDASGIGLNISASGFTPTGHLAANGSTSGGVKTFTVTVEYDDTAAVTSGTANIDITGLTPTLTPPYTYGGVTKTTSVAVIDGQAAARAIPVNNTNIKAFNAYANSNANSYAGLSRHYKLEASVTLPTVAAGSSNWTRIGWNGQNFTGSFDGQNYTISNLTIDSTSGDQGLFGYIGGAGVVKNLGLVGGTVKGTQNIAGVAGWNQGTIENCYSSVNVIANATGMSDAGCLVGYNSGGIKDCYATGDVTGADRAEGGLAGLNSGTIENCYYSGTVIGDKSVGGIAGENSGTIKNSHANITVYAGDIRAGGIVGLNDDMVENCYSMGTVEALVNYVGSIAGVNQGTGTVRNCVALNISITGGSSAKRISEGSFGSYNNNYAQSGIPVTIAGTPTYPSGSPNDENGADIPVGSETNQTWWTTTSGLPWSWGSSTSAPWKWGSGRPVLWFE